MKREQQSQLAFSKHICIQCASAARTHWSWYTFLSECFECTFWVLLRPNMSNYLQTHPVEEQKISRRTKRLTEKQSSVFLAQVDFFFSAKTVCFRWKLRSSYSNSLVNVPAPRKTTVTVLMICTNLSIHELSKNDFFDFIEQKEDVIPVPRHFEKSVLHGARNRRGLVFKSCPMLSDSPNNENFPMDPASFYRTIFR